MQIKNQRLIFFSPSKYRTLFSPLVLGKFFLVTEYPLVYVNSLRYKPIDR